MVRASAVVNAGPDPLKPANKIHAAVGPQIAAILNKAMAQKPEDRYADANEFREALRRMGRTKDGRAEKEPGRKKRQPGPKRGEAGGRGCLVRGRVLPDTFIICQRLRRL